MKQLLALILLTAACEQEPQDQAAAPPSTTTKDVLATSAPASKPPAVIPMPKDQAELDRMILAGYTPHGSHLHPPGVKECPLAQGSEAVM